MFYILADGFTLCDADRSNLDLIYTIHGANKGVRANDTILCVRRLTNARCYRLRDFFHGVSVSGAKGNTTCNLFN